MGTPGSDLLRGVPHSSCDVVVEASPMIDAHHDRRAQASHLFKQHAFCFVPLGIFGVLTILSRAIYFKTVVCNARTCCVVLIVAIVTLSHCRLGSSR